MKFLKDNLGLKLLSLVLAIVVYYAIKTETSPRNHMTGSYDRPFFQSR